MKLTFKEYLDSKEQLRKAVENVPVSTKLYEVVHYCTLVLGEYEEDKFSLVLKPRQHVVVEWKYDNIASPTPVSVKLLGVQSVNEDDQYQVFWSGEKLQKWLYRHTRGL